ncbi:cytochrome P450 [Mycolicibacterium sp. XJ1819]
MAEQYGGAFGFGFDPEDVARFRDAEHQPYLAQLAATCPARRTGDGSLQVLRMAEVREFNHHPSVEAFSLANKMSDELGLGAQRDLIPLNYNGEEHKSYRRVLDPLFAPQQVKVFEPAVRTLTNELIDTFIDRGEADVYDGFCAILPATIFCRIVGIPDSDVAMFIQNKNDLLRVEPGEPMEKTVERQNMAGMKCYMYFNDVLEKRAAADHKSDDLLTWLTEAERNGEKLTREEVLDILFLLMIAGLDTVAATLSCALSWLARHPERRKEIVADPSLWPQVVEEILRTETPVPATTRIAVKDVEIAGHQVEAGTAVHFSWAAANLDPDTFDNPLEVDFTRKRSPHVAFASGFHRCLGSHLARLELRTALDEFHQRIPEYRLQPGATLEYETLPVRLVRPLPLEWEA